MLRNPEENCAIHESQEEMMLYIFKVPKIVIVFAVLWSVRLSSWYNITCVMNCQSFWEMHLCYYYFWQKKKFLCSTILNHHLFSSLFDVLEGTAGFQLVLHKILLLESTLKCDCKIEILLLKVLNASSIQATQ